METGFPISILFAGAGALGATLLSLIVAIAISRSRNSDLLPWAVTAAGLVGLSIATLICVRSAIERLHELQEGGGIGSTAALLWESTQPIRWSLYASAIVLVIALLFALTQRRSQPTAPRRDLWIAGALFTLAVAVNVFAVERFLRMSRTVIGVVNPSATHIGSIADIASNIARLLLMTAGLSILALVLSLAALMLCSSVVPGSAPARGVNMAILVALLIVDVGAIVAVDSWCSLLRQTALTGSLPAA